MRHSSFLRRIANKGFAVGNVVKVLTDRGDLSNNGAVVQLQCGCLSRRIFVEVGRLAVLASHQIDLFERQFNAKLCSVHANHLRVRTHGVIKFHMRFPLSLCCCDAGFSITTRQYFAFLSTAPRAAVLHRFAESRLKYRPEIARRPCVRREAVC